ncbi:MAG: S8 family peptidase [Cellulosilyticaceae bacterium]
MEPKSDAELNILFNFTDSEFAQTPLDPNEQVIVKYNGDIEDVVKREGGRVQIINNQFAAVKISLKKAQNLLKYSQIEYMEAPKNFSYSLETSMPGACVTPVQSKNSYGLTGKGVILGIVDSGIYYQHPDFRNSDGTTRILALWDQTVKGKPPRGFDEGTEYTSEQINEALSKKTKREQQEIVPSEDTNGHGTHVASIAGGNGRASSGRNVGAAPEAEFIIVKLGAATGSALVRTIDIMLGIKYVVEKAKELGKPIVVNLSIGMNEGSHDGKTLIEQYINDISQVWKTNIVVGSGNEGNSRNHYNGKVLMGKASVFEFHIGANKKTCNLSIWQQFIDIMAFEVVAPNGERSTRMAFNSPPSRFILGKTKIFMSFAGPSPLNGDIEFAIYFVGQNNQPINEGNWSIIVYGDKIVDGEYNVWGEIQAQAGNNTFFIQSDPNITLTTPSTAAQVITVGAYDSVTEQSAVFSGRGFNRTSNSIKPDIVAPGVNIVAASNTGGYRTLSGTSMAAPHVTGAIALMHQWGIVENRNPFLYGESVRTFLLRGARRDVVDINYPSPVWGYGKLCLRNTMDILRRSLFV